MRKYKTRKQELYFDEVIRLHYEEGYGEDRISSIIPVGHTTVARWIAIFASEKDIVSDMKKSPDPVPQSSSDIEVLQQEIARWRRELRMSQIRTEALDELIYVAESQFNIKIRKKAGAKQ